MAEKVKLKDIADIYSGAILTRITAKDSVNDKVVDVRKVIVPKAILDDGTICINDLPEERFKKEVDDRCIAKVDDIVMKLSTPYDSAIITEETAGCAVPSFCARIRYNKTLDLQYLQTFLSSSICKKQLQKQAAGAYAGFVSIGRVGEVLIPLPSIEKQREIGLSYKQAQERMTVIKKIVDLENKKIEVIIKELFDYGK